MVAVVTGPQNVLHKEPHSTSVRSFGCSFIHFLAYASEKQRLQVNPQSPFVSRPGGRVCITSRVFEHGHGIWTR